MNDQVTGVLFLGPEENRDPQTFCSHDPATGLPLQPVFSEATAEDVAKACSFAEEAFYTNCYQIGPLEQCRGRLKIYLS